jgi:hypothetical protein
MTDTTPSCIVCGGTKDLKPLFLDSMPETQPVTWIHLECLAPALEDETADMQAAFQRLRESQHPAKKDD